MTTEIRVRDKPAVTIVGAGLVGSLLAVLLARRGFCVELFERNPDARIEDAPAGRSINLALSERGRVALAEADLLATVDTFSLPMAGRMMHYEDGSEVFQAYGKNPSEVNYSVHRARLNHCMLEAAETTRCVRLHFNRKLRSVDFDAKKARFENTLEGGIEEHPYQVLIGADGAFSALREAMAAERDIGAEIEPLSHGYRELTIPPTDSGEFALDPGALHIWPRGGYMLIALPNADHSFTATLFMAHQHDERQPGFDQLDSWQAQREFVATNFTDALPLLTRLRTDFDEHPESRLATIRTRRWDYADCLLIGDAAHGIVPFHGQGMNAGFEDCTELLKLLDADPDASWQSLFRQFCRRRRDDTDAIAEMALENYEVMRNSVRDPAFLLRKALEHELERRYPEKFIARYSLVMFHRLPYAEVYRRGLKQAVLLDRLLEGAGSLDAVDWQRADSLLREMPPLNPRN